MDDTPHPWHWAKTDMDIQIRKYSAADADSVVALCREAQEIHADLFPDVFKRLDSTALSEWFHERLAEDV